MSKPTKKPNLSVAGGGQGLQPAPEASEVAVQMLGTKPGIPPTLGASSPSPALSPLKVPISIRPAVPEDLPFIFATWLRAYKASSWFAKKIPNIVFFKYHHMVIERILARSATVLVATPTGPDASGIILGYVVYEGPVLHFVHVKGAWRRYGIATALFKEASLKPGSTLFTHWTFDGDVLVKKYPQAIYNPYLI